MHATNTAGSFRWRHAPLILLVLACGGDELTVSPRFGPPARLTLSPSELILDVGAEEQFDVFAYDAKDRRVGIAIEWSSADPTVAAIGRFDGVITAMSSGSTLVTATAGALRATATVFVEADTVFIQWAISATAGSEHVSSAWSASQATGAPNVRACVDEGGAWASMWPEVDWLEVSFAEPVRPTEIRIYEVWAVGSVVKVEVKDLSGMYKTVYGAAPTSELPCPWSLTVPVTDVTARISAVRVTVDQRARADWDLIDAVRLTGVR